MKLKFKHQQFQADAAKAVCDVFIGQPCQSGMRYLVDPGKSRKSAAPLMDMHGYRNAPLADHMDSDKLRNNLHAVQERNLLKHSGEFSQGINLTVEMETGTGKTYTYIKTMYELNKQYGWTKFIIVVPSVAIREGVYKSFAVTQEHFASDYGKKIRYFIYDSKNLTEIDRFAADSAINVMIINAQAFNATGKDARRINMKLDAFRSRRPIDVIAATNPILIIDEPQSVEGKKTKEKLKAFNPLMTLRYSATPREEYNIVYRLDAIDAYNKKLVKKIAVKGITASTSMATGGYVFFSEIKTSKVRPPMAVLDFDKKGKNSIRSIRRTLGEGENLYQLSGELEEYKGNYIISRINANTNTVEFVNGITLHVGEAVGDFTEDQLRRVQIRETILSHLQ
ncbi:MAG: DEAD/DEAH box helicase family protein, partial [Selenomonas sp.]|nr:DEAD/DEAH box helicase family protein [Selenomonas sp.]